MSLAKALIVGNLTEDPELRYTPKRNAVCTMRVAANRYYRDTHGDKKQQTVYVDVEAWRRLAETCGKNLKKGRKVLIEGRLSQDHWEDKDTGKKRSRIYVTAERVLFLSPRGDAGSEEEVVEEDASVEEHETAGADVGF